MQIAQQGPLSVVKIGDTEYQIHRIGAIKQFHIVRRMAPVIASLIPLFNVSGALSGLLDTDDEGALRMSQERRKEILEEIVGAIPDVATAFAKLSDEDSEYILNTCLDACWRKQETGWARVRANGQMMFANLELTTLMRLAFESIRGNLGGFFDRDRLKASAAGPGQS